MHLHWNYIYIASIFSCLFDAIIRYIHGIHGVLSSSSLLQKLLFVLDFLIILMHNIISLFLLCLILQAVWVVVALFCMSRLVAGLTSVYNVVDFGAVGDGQSDDSKAFLEAWGKTCADAAYSTFLIPSGKTFLVGKLMFEGPCKSNVHVQVSGNLVAPNDLSNEELNHWITFYNVNGLTVDGYGLIDGRGPIWWPCKLKNILVFISCNNLKVKEIKLKDSPGKHLSIDKSIGVEINGVTITSPGDSPNTDGIYLGDSHHVQVTGCTIASGVCVCVCVILLLSNLLFKSFIMLKCNAVHNKYLINNACAGDDCIAIGSGCSDVNVTQITCGPGHGISIGSLGIDGSTSQVDQVHVSTCTLFNTTNGVRIKTWQGGSGYAKDISFEHMNMSAVQAPIVIDQYYCPDQTNCPKKPSAVQLSNVKYEDIHGTSTGKVAAISLACSDVAPCTGLIMSNINLETPTKPYSPKPYCSNARGRSIGSVIPNVPCLS
ncbi:putative endo-polygalacturonase [Dioscorea sansibarensis]